MEELLADIRFRQALEEIAVEESRPFEAIESEAKVYIKELYSTQNPVFQSIGLQIVQYILSRGYDKSIDVNEQELKKLARLMRRHSIAFIMTHKTYIDMFVLAVVLARYGLPIPYIFSGINMGFLGLGELGRKTGAIFIRRSFKDNKVYKLSLRHFISSVVDKRQHFMWAIEGTRSRTGKLVWPKMGILKYIIEAEENSRNEVKYVPVSIVYDLIPDVDEMTKEGRGKDKGKENLFWFLNYIRKMEKDFGKISIRFGDPVPIYQSDNAVIPHMEDSQNKGTLSKIAFEIVHDINKITPVTTASLICISLLSQFALSNKSIELIVLQLMALIEYNKADALVDRGKPISQSVQSSINLLIQSNLIRQLGEGRQAKYSIIPENYLTATYYANMAVHHLYHRAFIELALVHISKYKVQDRMNLFWTEIMRLRDLFKFEFFYSNKADFSDQIESNLNFLDPNWEELILKDDFTPDMLLKDQHIVVANVVLTTYLEAYKVVGHTLKSLSVNESYSDADLITNCLFVGEELHWKGKIHRVDSVSKPFIINGIRLAKNKNLIPDGKRAKFEQIDSWINELTELQEHIKSLDSYVTDVQFESKVIPIDKNIIPGTNYESITDAVLNGERGPHIGAFFDLDRTLINGFSAKQFLTTRIKSGKMTPKEAIGQFGGVIVYAMGNRNFGGLASVSAKGVKGIEEKVFIEMGEEVYLKHLAKSIFPESRALVEAHFEMGHTVAIISAATPYQVNPIARDLGIQHVMCTRMEVAKGKFTGNIVQPPCWGQGKSDAAIKLAEEHDLDLEKSHFYTDSIDDLPLMQIVGHPHPVNPDHELSKVAFENNWEISRFTEIEDPGVVNIARTIAAFGSLIPAAFTGVAMGSMNFSKRDGINNMIGIVGDLGCSLAGIKLVVKGVEHIDNNRPAVFLFNHQSNVDFLILAKLLRRDVIAVAKKELKASPVGPFFSAAGVVFVDRKNKDKAIEALKPAVDEIKKGLSLAIAPEGTRSYDYNLGAFKKGAFHMAMDAGVPVVPIVIKNAHDIMPRGTSLVRPAVVEVVVLPAFHTNDWNRKKLNEHIEEVRQAYLKELNQL